MQHLETKSFNERKRVVKDKRSVFHISTSLYENKEAAILIHVNMISHHHNSQAANDETKDRVLNDQ